MRFIINESEEKPPVRIWLEENETEAEEFSFIGMISDIFRAFEVLF